MQRMPRGHQHGNNGNVHQCYINMETCACRTRRLFSSNTTVLKKMLDKSFGKSSSEWLTRHINDPYVQKAKMENYRARSAFKLLEMDDKLKLLSPGMVVIDCGAAPGAWTQVAVKRTNATGENLKKPKGTVISVDILPFHPIDGAISLVPMDFTASKTQDAVLASLSGKKVDLLLSDMAPRATGVRSLDQDLILDLSSAALKFALQVSSLGSGIILKLWDGGGVANLKKTMALHYETVRVIKPPSSRSDSAELFLFGRSRKNVM